MAYPGATGPYFAPSAPPAAQAETLDTRLVGGNWIFVAIIPYVLATALQVSSIKTALIVGTVVSAVIVVIGILLWLAKARYTPIFILDAAMLVTMAVQLGVVFEFEEDIEKNYIFITNSALAGICILSMLLRYPATLQNERECVPREGWRVGDVKAAGFITTGTLAACLIVALLLYIIPIAEDTWQDHEDALTIVFQIVVPIVLFALGLLLVRLYPMFIAKRFDNSEGFDEASMYVVYNPTGMK